MKANRIHLILILTITGLFLSGAVAISQQTAGQLYEKAIYLEEAKGSLQEAIDLYNQIAENKNADQSFQVKALLHMGLCYEKLGKQEAVKSYQRLVNNFPTYKNEVAIARERLSQLLLAENVSKKPVTPEFTKIEIPTKPGNGVLSPDGKKLAYIAEKSLWVVPVHGNTNPNIAGEPFRLTEPMDAWDLANMCVVWSANGKWLAFYVTENREDVIYIVSADGSKPVKVPLNQKRPDIGGYDYRMSLSPDGSILAFVDRDENKNSFIYAISIKGGSQRKLTGPGTREPAFSPDGKFIAYVKLKPESNLGDEIWVIPSIGGEAVLVCDEADVTKSPVWSPDGSMIAFLARKYEEGWANNSNELWIAAVDRNRKPTGLITKTKLSNSTTLMLAGWSPDNKIGVWLAEPEKNLLYTVPATGGQAMQITSKNSWMPCWSPDGKYLYFDGINTGNFAGVESVPAFGGEVSRIPIRFRETIQPEMPIGGISVSPDGEKIVFETYYNNGSANQKKPEGFHHIVTLPIGGGSPFELTTNSLLDGYPVWSPDGRNIAFSRQEDQTAENIFTIPAEGGTPKKITSFKDSVTFGRIDWSPDGKWIGYFSADNTIKMVPAEGGNSKVVIKDVETNSHFGLSFSPDGDKITYSNKEKLYVVDLNSGKKEEILTGIDAIPTMPAWSPDGRKIAFCAYAEGETDLWFMGNFLPLEKLEMVPTKENIVIRKVMDGTGAGYAYGNPSPDGKYFAYIDWSSYPNDIVIREIGTDKEKRLKNQTDLNFNKDDGCPYNFIWSPDSKRIAYTWENDDEEFCDLRIIDINKYEAEVLKRVSYFENWLTPLDWSPDGKHILALFNQKDHDQLGLMSVKDGSFVPLKNLEGSRPIAAKFSPDGHSIAYDLAPNKENPNHDIYILSNDNKKETRLTSHPSHDFLLDWTPSGGKILFASDRKGTTDIWSISFNKETSLSMPVLITTNVGSIKPMDCTQNGFLYYSTPGSWWDIYTVKINPDNKSVAGTPLEVPLPNQGYNMHSAWSPDGNFLIYTSGQGSARNNPRRLMIYSTETGLSKHINFKGDVYFPTWFPDNRSVMINGCYVLDIISGEITDTIQLRQHNEDEIRSVYISSDSRYIYFVRENRELDLHAISKKDLKTGIIKELYRTPDDCLTIALSPDNKQLAVQSRQQESIRIVKIMSTETGEKREIHKFDEKEYHYISVAWSPDGKYIYFSKPIESKRGLWRISASGGEAEYLGVKNYNFAGISIHPDGQQVTFYSFVGKQKPGEIWVMENFLPD